MIYNIHYVDSIICLCFGVPDWGVMRFVGRLDFYAVVLLKWGCSLIYANGLYLGSFLRCGDFLMMQCGVVSLGNCLLRDW